jgi:hypothetical protein
MPTKQLQAVLLYAVAVMEHAVALLMSHDKHVHVRRTQVMMWPGGCKVGMPSAVRPNPGLFVHAHDLDRGRAVRQPLAGDGTHGVGRVRTGAEGQQHPAAACLPRLRVLHPMPWNARRVGEPERPNGVRSLCISLPARPGNSSVEGQLNPHGQGSTCVATAVRDLGEPQPPPQAVQLCSLCDHSI